MRHALITTHLLRQARDAAIAQAEADERLEHQAGMLPRAQPVEPGRLARVVPWPAASVPWRHGPPDRRQVNSNEPQVRRYQRIDRQTPRFEAIHRPVPGRLRHHPGGRAGGQPGRGHRRPGHDPSLHHPPGAPTGTEPALGWPTAAGPTHCLTRYHPPGCPSTPTKRGTPLPVRRGQSSHLWCPSLEATAQQAGPPTPHRRVR
jgi:hypothetical protein